MGAAPFQLTRIMDPNDGDMTFGQGLANFARDAQACVQNVETRLRSYLGEWFLDTSFGTPWMQDILGVKPANVPLSEADLKAVILGTTGVDAIKTFEFTQTNRNITVRASITTLYGTLENVEVTI